MAKIILIGVILSKERITVIAVKIGSLVKIIKEIEERMFLEMCGRRFDKAKEYYGVPSLDRVVREVYCSHDCAEKYKSDPHGKVEYLPQTWEEVKNQLAQVLAELKKLKNNSSNKDSEKLEQQIVQNEKLIKEGENLSVAEVQEQVNKSQALMKEFNNVSATEDNKVGNGSLPYVVGGSVILASAGIIGYFLLKKNKRK
ncbi:5702_t:CDS:2 [Paraglomus brasilianum]|uniref:5702_t:CDS:1 n=1 Tax=Paraglomus brasilianum TaxID=144538 RepID=A0A9N8ZS79_9GLOM|nr:5702_t:CDS:2 [Paraglomus brasilianum]